MSAKFIKVIRDLQADKTRTALVFFALFLGLWSFGNVFLLNYILSKDLNLNFQQTAPAHAILTSNQFQTITAESLALMPHVSSYEFRDFSRHRMEINPGEWIPLLLQGVQDFTHQSVARFAPESGLSIPASGSLLVERNVLLISNLQIGKSSRIRVGRKESFMEVAGIVFDPAQPPATQDHFVYAYTDQQTYTDLTGLPLNHRLLVRFSEDSSQQQIEDNTDRLIDWFAQKNIQMSAFKIPALNKHPHQWQLDTLLFLVGSIGLLALILSSVIVTQLMASVMAREMRQIGIARALGATRPQVIGIYATYVLLITLAAMLVTFPFTWMTTYTFSYFVAGILNFNVLTTSLPLWVYATWIAGSLLIPVACALPAILAGTRMSVCDALNNHGLSTSIKKSALNESALPEEPVLSRVLNFSMKSATAMVYALRNTLRNKRMLLGTLLTMALGIGIFGTGFNIRTSLSVFLENVDKSLVHDVKIVLNQTVSRSDIENILSPVSGVKSFELWNGGTGALQTQILGTSSGIGIVSLPADTTMYRPVFETGRWISDLSASSIPEVVINQQAVEVLHNPKLGAIFPIIFEGISYDVKLVGKISEFDKAKIYVSQTWAAHALGLPDRYNTVLIKLENTNYDSVLSAKRQVENALSKSDLDIAYVLAQPERMKIIYDHLNIILSTLLILAFIVLLVSAMGMASAMAIDIINRTREIGVLRAIGATSEQITRLFEIEGFIVVLVSVLLGLALSYPLSQIASIFFGHLMLGEEAELELVLSGSGIVITILTTLIFGWLASRRTARLALTLSTREALAYE